MHSCRIVSRRERPLSRSSIRIFRGIFGFFASGKYAHPAASPRNRVKRRSHLTPWIVKWWSPGMMIWCHVAYGLSTAFLASLPHLPTGHSESAHANLLTNRFSRTTGHPHFEHADPS